jgi:hypothetical protein
MYTSILLVALMGPGAAADAQSSEPLSWQENYTAARKLARQEDKPLAVVIGSGARGWEKLGTGKLTAEAKKLLADNYVCVYIDADTTRGKRLADEFSLSQGLVISTRDGQEQAFRHSGPISNSDLEASLKRYSTDFVSTTTETLDSQGVEEQQMRGGRGGRGQGGAGQGGYGQGGYIGGYYDGGFGGGGCGYGGCSIGGCGGGGCGYGWGGCGGGRCGHRHRGCRGRCR